ncbi:MAG: PEP-utilizing enzyme [Actinomycetota bacterium]|nr:PEP-utilizing enzyme [Actinomycetota bacterium]
MSVPTKATRDPPGPGSWICERSHGSPGRTPVYQRISAQHTGPTYRQVFADYGGAVDTIEFRWVNGAMFRRLVPLIGADRDTGKVPPKAVLWLATRLHPAFRRREKQADRMMADKAFLQPIRACNAGEREKWRAENLAFQSVALVDLADSGLADHLDELDRHLVAGWCRHHQLHGNNLGDLLAHAKGWGLDTTAVMGLLRGSSLATVDVTAHGRDIAEALRSGGADPATVSSIEDIRTVPAAGAALDAYPEEFGCRLVSSYDIDGRTLNEVPGAVCALARKCAVQAPADPAEAEARVGIAQVELRAQSPDPAAFDDLLSTAREAYGVRDDNGPMTWEWPAGLARRAYVEAGARLAASATIDDPDHVFELDLPEVSALLRDRAKQSGAGLIDSDAVRRRAELRAWQATLESPDVLGPPPPEPDLSPLPPGIRRTMGLIVAAVSMLDPDPKRDAVRLTGLGIGTQPYVGRARVATEPNQAFQEMEPGDVLVVPWTAPSYNAVLAIAGAVVVEQGGLLCHAAVMCRELNIPGVVGCVDAMTAISSGDLVEVDPTTGTVRLCA